MPEGTKVDDEYKALRREGMDEGKAARIAQSDTGEALATGKPPVEKNEMDEGAAPAQAMPKKAKHERLYALARKRGYTPAAAALMARKAKGLSKHCKEPPKRYCHDCKKWDCSHVAGTPLAQPPAPSPMPSPVAKYAMSKGKIESLTAEQIADLKAQILELCDDCDPMGTIRLPHAGVKTVWKVHGRAYKIEHDMDFVEAGNGYRWPFISKDEICIDEGRDEDEWPFNVLHESDESDRMAQGEDYDSAHAHANKLEKAWSLEREMNELADNIPCSICGERGCEHVAENVAKYCVAKYAMKANVARGREASETGKTGKHWITIHPHGHNGQGVHVEIEDGTIVKGPSGLEGKPLDDLGGGREQGQQQQPEQGAEQAQAPQQQPLAATAPPAEEPFTLQPTTDTKRDPAQFPDYGKETQKTMLSLGGAPGQQDLFNTEGSEPERGLQSTPSDKPKFAKGLQRQFMLGGQSGDRNTVNFPDGPSADLYEYATQNRARGSGRAGRGNTGTGKTGAEQKSNARNMLPEVMQEFGFTDEGEFNQYADDYYNSVKDEAKRGGDGADVSVPSAAKKTPEAVAAPTEPPSVPQAMESASVPPSRKELEEAEAKALEDGYQQKVPMAKGKPKSAKAQDSAARKAYDEAVASGKIPEDALPKVNAKDKEPEDPEKVTADKKAAAQAKRKGTAEAKLAAKQEKEQLAQTTADELGVSLSQLKGVASDFLGGNDEIHDYNSQLKQLMADHDLSPEKLEKIRNGDENADVIEHVKDDIISEAATMYPQLGLREDSTAQDIIDLIDAGPQEEPSWLDRIDEAAAVIEAEMGTDTKDYHDEAEKMLAEADHEKLSPDQEQEAMAATRGEDERGHSQEKTPRTVLEDQAPEDERMAAPSEKPTEKPMPSKPTEKPMPSKPTEKPMPSKPAEKPKAAAAEKPNAAASEKPREPHKPLAQTEREPEVSEKEVKDVKISTPDQAHHNYQDNLQRLHKAGKLEGTPTPEEAAKQVAAIDEEKAAEKAKKGSVKKSKPEDLAPPKTGNKLSPEDYAARKQADAEFVERREKAKGERAKISQEAKAKTKKFLQDARERLKKSGSNPELEKALGGWLRSLADESSAFWDIRVVAGAMRRYNSRRSGPNNRKAWTPTK